MDEGWEVPPGYPEGIKQKVLTSDRDETAKTGSRSRLLRFDPGAYSTEPFVHDHWEEVYLVNGTLTVGNDAQGAGGEPFDAPTYACRPPGGFPWSLQIGRRLLAFRAALLRADGRLLGELAVLALVEEQGRFVASELHIVDLGDDDIVVAAFILRVFCAQ